MAQPIQFTQDNTPKFGVPRGLDELQNPPSGENVTAQVVDEGEMPLEARKWL